MCCIHLLNVYVLVMAAKRRRVRKRRQVRRRKVRKRPIKRRKRKRRYYKKKAMQVLKHSPAFF